MTDPRPLWDVSFDGLLRNHLPHLPPDQPLVPDLDLRAYGLDSLGTVNLLMDLEEAYHIEIPDELLTFEIFTSPATLWHAVAGLRGAA